VRPETPAKAPILSVARPWSECETFAKQEIDPLPVAASLWARTHAFASAAVTIDGERAQPDHVTYRQVRSMLHFFQGAIVVGRYRIPVHSVDDLLTLLMGLPPSSELKQVYCLNFEQATLDRGSTTQSP